MLTLEQHKLIAVQFDDSKHQVGIQMEAELSPIVCPLGINNQEDLFAG